MSKEVKNLAASIHDRLLRKAKQEGQTFDQLLYYYALERFLYRLYHSRYRQEFVLKGALMFFGWGLPLRRFTRDIDLQGHTANSIENIAAILREVCAQPVDPPDGMVFDPDSLAGEEILADAEYQGVRIRFRGYLAHMPVNLQVDVSFASRITPGEVTVDYPTLLGTPAFKIRGYPFETAIAEKFQAMVVLDLANDRLKDFYDIWLISRTFKIQGKVLVEAIRNTFDARSTSIPTQIPTALTERFAGEKRLGWVRFVERLPVKDGVPTDFGQVLAELSAFLLPPMQAAARGEKFTKVWNVQTGWQLA